MLKTEFDRIMSLFSDCAEGRPVAVEEVFREALNFFEQVNLTLKEGPPEEKRQALQMMGEMYRKMIETSQKLVTQTGLNPEQLSGFTENPANFSPEQWKAMQGAKERMASLSQDLIQTLETLNPHLPKDAKPEKAKEI